MMGTETVKLWLTTVDGLPQHRGHFDVTVEADSREEAVEILKRRFKFLLENDFEDELLQLRSQNSELLADLLRRDNA